MRPRRWRPRQVEDGLGDAARRPCPSRRPSRQELARLARATVRVIGRAPRVVPGRCALSATARPLVSTQDADLPDRATGRREPTGRAWTSRRSASARCRRGSAMPDASAIGRLRSPRRLPRARHGSFALPRGYAPTQARPRRRSWRTATTARRTSSASPPRSTDPVDRLEAPRARAHASRSRPRTRGSLPVRVRDRARASARRGRRARASASRSTISTSSSMR